MPVLYLIPTALSETQELETVPPYILSICNSLSYYLVENERTARRYLSKIGLKGKIETLELRVLNKQTDPATISMLMKPALSGSDIGLMSEAGVPGIADPGARAVAFAHQHNITVRPLVGPSSIFMALMASGFNGQQFQFHGYLPIDKTARVREIGRLEQESKRTGAAQIFMETPYRNQAMYVDLIENLKPATWLHISAEITGEGEWIKSEQVKNWRQATPPIGKRPAIFIIQV